MAAVTTEHQTLQELIDRLGGIPLFRVLVDPPLGQATEADLLKPHRGRKPLCELVDGVLVEKAMGYLESMLAAALCGILRDFIMPRNLGIVTGADGMVRLFPGLVRMPDVAFVSWERIPGGRIPVEPIPQLAPDLAVEVLSKSNTPAEMNRKLEEYFAAGVDFVWLVDPDERTVEAYERGEKLPKVYHRTETIEGRASLAGFRLVLADLFAELDRHR
jgi:Uma2 family endonuclease